MVKFSRYIEEDGRRFTGAENTKILIGPEWEKVELCTRSYLMRETQKTV